MNDMTPAPEPKPSFSEPDIEQLKKYARAGKAAEEFLEKLMSDSKQPLSESLALFITETAESLDLEIKEIKS